MVLTTLFLFSSYKAHIHKRLYKRVFFIILFMFLFLTTLNFEKFPSGSAYTLEVDALKVSFVPFKTETQEGGYIRTSLQIQVGQETFGCFLEDVAFDYDYC